MSERLLDIFCGGGGAAMGYSRAGFDVFGIDIERQPDYPFGFHQRDALEALVALLNGERICFKAQQRPSRYYRLRDFDAIHASPPCQGYTSMSNRWRGKGTEADGWPRLIGMVRQLLIASGLPYIIENVTGARSAMLDPILLSGGMFGLRVERPRLFESNVEFTAPPQRRAEDPIGVYGAADGRRLFTRKDGTHLRAASSHKEGAEAMGVSWIQSWRQVTESIPPAYTEYLGTQLLDDMVASDRSA